MRDVFEFLETYVAILRISVKDMLAYKGDFILSAIFRLAPPIIMLFVWSVIYSTSHVNSIAGFTLSTIYAYFFLTVAVHFLADSDIDELIQDDVQNGSVASSLVKPIRYPIKLIFQSLGINIFPVLMTSIPLLIAVSFFFPLNITPITVLFFVCAIILANIVVIDLDFLIGSLAIYLTSVWGIASVFWSIVALLAGRIVPINFFPPMAQNIILLLPFQLLAYTPAALLLGLITADSAMHELIVGAIWAVFLTLFSYMWWERSVKSVMSAGG